MKIEFNSMEEQRIPNFKGGEGEFIAKMNGDDNNRILYGKLEPGCSIGYHKHETSSEIIYILSGRGTCRMGENEEILVAGDCHYCPKGDSHGLFNNSQEDLVFFAVVPEQ